MTTPNQPGAGVNNNYFLPANRPNAATSGLSQFAAADEEFWNDYAYDQWDPKFKHMGEPVDVLRTLTHAVIAAFQGDIGPLGALVSGTVRDIVMTPLSVLLSWIAGGDPEDWDTLEEIRDDLLPALIRLPLKILVQLVGNIPVVGDKFEEALAKFLKTTNETAVDAAETAVSVGTQVNYVQQVIALQSGMGVWETGPDRTGTPSFPFSNLTINAHTHELSGQTSIVMLDNVQHRHGVGTLVVEPNSSAVPTVNVTATYAPWANVIFKTAAERKVLTWMAYKTGTVSTFNLDVYKLEQDGSSSLLYSSPNLAGDVPVSLSSIGWMQHLMSSQTIVADVGDIYDVQFRMTGSGSVSLAGINFPNPTPLPGFRPYTIGSARNASATPAPTTIATSTRDTMYTGPAPFVSIGIDVGQTQIPRFFYDDFNRASLGTRWITYGSSVGIKDGKVEFTGSAFANASAAAMYHQPLATDVVEVGADLSIDEEDIGVGVHCQSGLGNGVWLTADVGGVRIQTGAYNSRTDRVTATVPGSGRYTLRAIRDEGDTHFIYQAFFGDPNAESAVPVLTWPDTTNSVPSGIGRRWWSVLARRNGLIYPSGRLDNVTAADITIEEETP
ncbi:minor tail protein [Gordonia phage LitninMcQueen]